ncbi:hypothetical protein DOTSEDRAFT_69155 [Dothistroma septosporum NZE10]|uniref:DUF221-domain-containing protein n=1 Tax=Dothistroma septosporum (strain NZE10 / CBS 128990) TaxID=675120 RepID=N1PUF4_DOTSN|nr:hypothetical protein DOTSEDRAFT_69155 [Dothistroma septosporum NZE10]
MDVPAPTATCKSGIFGLIDCNAGAATTNEGTTVGALVAAIAGSLVSLGVQLLIFLLLRLRLSRIYTPKSYLVPERERVQAPPGGIIGWLYPLFTTNNLTLIQKCGLDAYFFLRFLRMLLKLFFPAALIIIPILLPINKTAHADDVHGLDLYSISNIGKPYAGRLWAHTILAVMFVAWFFYVVFKELRGYIRVRQAFLTSPQHRIRASATTVLVTGIPQKWLTLEALSGLYDVFPGGIRNIWINRNFDELADKVSLRDKLAKNLEDAETVLIKKCRTKHMEAEKKKAKAAGRKAKTKDEKKQDKANEDAAAEQMAHGDGVSAGGEQQNQLPQGMQDILEEEERQHDKMEQQRTKNPLGVFGQGLDGVGHGFHKFGKGIGQFGNRIVGGVDSELHKAGHDFNRTADTLNTGGLAGGFAMDESLYKVPTAGDGPSSPRPSTVRSRGANASPRLPGGAQIDTLPRATRHPLAPQDSPTSDDTLRVRDFQSQRPKAEPRQREPLNIEEPPTYTAKRKPWELFKNNDRSLVLPSPQPHVQEEDEYPLHTLASGDKEGVRKDSTEKDISDSKVTEKLQFWKKGDRKPTEYAQSHDKDWDEDQDEEPYWRRYMEPKDRETIRLPIFSASWWPALPLMGKKVDRIYECRRQLARLNSEIEADQNDIEKYPYMNSAFIQFNHQVAAHMCCQSLSHHVPQQMAPRLVEISPDDVLWDNMAIKWWERYVRTVVVLIIAAALIVFYAIPVAFTSLLNHITTLAQVVPWLSWLANAPKVVQSIIQGLLPPALLALILLLVPIIFRLLVKQQGVATGNAKELGVQQWYFAFLFIQVFLVVTISGGLTTFFSEAASNPGSIVSQLASNLPKASTYFFSYLTVQALSNSASALLQVGSLFMWFIMAPISDSTARAKWKRQTNLNNVQWGTFFPPFTNFAAIGMVYSIISPLIIVFMIFIFGLFWIVQRYNVLFVYQFRNDTGGLLFPVAINQLFTGLYFLELCLIGLFFTISGEAFPQAIIMIVLLVATICYQWLLNMAFKPLFQYLPITLEDEAVIRDEEFARAQASKWAPLHQGDGGNEDPRDIQDVLEEQEQREHDANHAVEDAEKRETKQRSRSHTPGSAHSPDAGRQASTPRAGQRAWHERRDTSKPLWSTDKWKKVAPEAVGALRFLADGTRTTAQEHDPESQHTVGDVLFSGYADELEDLSPDERDVLVRYAFQHSALRARRPVVWIPRDALGVSDDEIKRAKKMSTVTVKDEDGGKEEKTNIWMSNEGTALDGKGRVVFRRSPPDFSNIDLIAL